MLLAPFAIGGTAALIMGIALIICLLWSFGIIPLMLFALVLGFFATLLGGTLASIAPALLYIVVGFFAGGMTWVLINDYIVRVESAVGVLTLAEISLFVAELAIELTMSAVNGGLESTFLVYIMGVLAVLWVLMVIYSFLAWLAK